jgi:predicted PurR-regulated permease PerM
MTTIKADETAARPDDGAAGLGLARRLAIGPGADAAMRISVVGLFVIAIFYTLYFAAPILIPITIAILLSMLLSPAVDWLERLALPRAVGSALIVAAALGLIAGSIVTLAGPAQEWLTRLPASFAKMEERLKLIKKPIAEIEKATEQIETVTELSQKSVRRQVVELRRPSFAGELLSGTQRIATSIGMVLILLYFLLATGDLFARKLVAIMPTDENRARTVDIVRSVKRDISFYLLSLTITNIGYGLLVTVAAAALGVENALLWGAATVIFSFAPYIGPVVIITLLTMASMISLPSLTAALALPAIYLTVLLTVQNLISPFIWGRRLALNPVAIFISIILWGWMWGMAGALLAVPLLASFKIVAERVGALRPAAELLGP